MRSAVSWSLSPPKGVLLHSLRVCFIVVKHEVENDAKTPEICRLAVPLASEDLRCSVVQRGGGRGHVSLFYQVSEPEIGDLDGLRRVLYSVRQVLGLLLLFFCDKPYLDVTMNYAERVAVLDRINNVTKGQGGLPLCDIASGDPAEE